MTCASRKNGIISIISSNDNNHNNNATQYWQQSLIVNNKVINSTANGILPTRDKTLPQSAAERGGTERDRVFEAGERGEAREL